MSANFTIEHRSGPRYMINLPVRAEWDDDTSGKHIVVDGETENVGPQGALVHLNQLPSVGSRVQLMVLSAQGQQLQTIAEVLRLERNPAQPLAALQLLNATEEWIGMVWEPSAPHLQTSDESGDESDF
ncbi:MAG: PilZ domain-containing protein [Pyrinomonadaceae bacterium]|nr:PilZ domain-containing protein [Pyrinomonadaceae bacterium]